MRFAKATSSGETLQKENQSFGMGWVVLDGQSPSAGWLLLKCSQLCCVEYVNVSRG